MFSQKNSNQYKIDDKMKYNNNFKDVIDLCK